MSKKHHEEHEEHPDETWLVPYSDVLTLLLALFIVLFAVSSKPTPAEVAALSESFRQAFNEYSGIFPGAILPIESVKPTLKDSKPSGPQEKEEAELETIRESIGAFTAASSIGSGIEAEMTDEGLLIIIKDNLLFQSGSAELMQSALGIARTLGTMLSTMRQKVIVSGHTDNGRIRTAEFPTNWELSSRRASNFMRYMLDHEPFLRPERFSVAGYGEYRPVASNLTEYGRQQNRRVEILVLRNYPNKIQPTPEVSTDGFE
ncbi:motility protein B [Deferribacterales bacterium]|nr:motility protein B [Deferribacterales bacterium]